MNMQMKKIFILIKKIFILMKFQIANFLDFFACFPREEFFVTKFRRTSYSNEEMQPLLATEINQNQYFNFQIPFLLQENFVENCAKVKSVIVPFAILLPNWRSPIKLVIFVHTNLHQVQVYVQLPIRIPIQFVYYAVLSNPMIKTM